MELNSHATMCQAGPGEAGSREKLHLDQYTPWSSLEVLKAGQPDLVGDTQPMAMGLELSDL